MWHDVQTLILLYYILISTLTLIVSLIVLVSIATAQGLQRKATSVSEPSQTKVWKYPSTNVIPSLNVTSMLGKHRDYGTLQFSDSHSVLSALSEPRQALLFIITSQDNAAGLKKTTGRRPPDGTKL